ncbi:hypothetical protein NDU88_012287 [Pleurodeles waltl]|uniref:Uncharacterized protein n=1 Tax=Pleurodeles waltl TaxID=8319 RepID=A0AAV7R3G3_PLEWA|nr:hypothetical protein NDU88_012287 [Pleurodeles waltl]
MQFVIYEENKGRDKTYLGVSSPSFCETLQHNLGTIGGKNPCSLRVPHFRDHVWIWIVATGPVELPRASGGGAGCRRRITFVSVRSIEGAGSAPWLVVIGGLLIRRQGALKGQAPRVDSSLYLRLLLRPGIIEEES